MEKYFGQMTRIYLKDAIVVE